MKQTLISALCVFLAVAAICTSSLYFIYSTADAAETLRMQSLERADTDDEDGAKEYLMKLAGLWRQSKPLFEIMVDHSTIHDVASHITDARISLERGFLDDYYKAMALMGEAIEHIRSHEGLSWSNLL